MLKRRRVIGRPLLVATAGIAAMAYACGSQVSGNLAPTDSGPPDMNASEVSGNLAVVEAGPDQTAPDAADASDASDASDATDASGDGG